MKLQERLQQIDAEMHQLHETCLELTHQRVKLKEGTQAYDQVISSLQKNFRQLAELKVEKLVVLGKLNNLQTNLF